MQIRCKINCEKSLISEPKNFQNGANIDAETHQKSMKKLITEKKWKNGKSCFAERLKHAKVFAGSHKQGFRPVSVQTTEVFRNMTNHVKILPKVEQTPMQNPCSKKWCLNDENYVQKGAQSEPTFQKYPKCRVLKNGIKIFKKTPQTQQPKDVLVNKKLIRATQSINQPIDQSINQLTNQPTNHPPPTTILPTSRKLGWWRCDRIVTIK